MCGLARSIIPKFLLYLGPLSSGRVTTGYVCECLVASNIDLLGLKRLHEAFGLGIVVRIAR